MARIVKKIKGRLYAYDRRSHREGKKVIQTWTYIGPIEPVYRTQEDILRNPDRFKPVPRPKPFKPKRPPREMPVRSHARVIRGHGVSGKTPSELAAEARKRMGGRRRG